MNNLIVLREGNLIIDRIEENLSKVVTNPITNGNFSNIIGQVIVSYIYDLSALTIVYLTSNGLLYSYQINNLSNITNKLYDCNINQSIDEISDDIIENTWFYIENITDVSKYICISYSGNIVSIIDIKQEESNNYICEYEGKIDNGISAAKWNINTTLLVLLTNNYTIILMSNQLDVINEIPITNYDINSYSSITWSPDSSQFVVLTNDVDSDSDSCKLRIYSNELVFLYYGRNNNDKETANYLLKGVNNCLSYSTNGTLIAFAQLKGKDKHQISFIERNGLTHGTFDVKNISSDNSIWMITNIYWDISSTLVMISLVNLDLNDKSSIILSKVQIYYRNNYYWYLKQEWTDKYISTLGFDKEIPNRLYLNRYLKSTSYITIIDVVWDINSTLSDDRSIIVNDGLTLNLTPYAVSKIPPPMYKYNILVNHSIRNINTCYDRESNISLVGLLLTNDIIEMRYIDKLGKPISNKKYILDFKSIYQHVYKIVDSKHNFNYITSRSLTLVSSVNELTICVVTTEDLVDKLYVITFNNLIKNYDIDAITLTINELSYVNIYSTTSLEQIGRVSLINSHAIAVSVINDKYIPNSSMDIYLLDLTLNRNSKLYNLFDLPSHCTIPEILTSYVVINRLDESIHDCKVIGLTNSYRLYCNDSIIVNGVTSYLINYKYNVLMYISSGTKPKLHYIPFDKLLSINLLDELNNSNDIIENENRLLERGSKLLISIDSNISIYLPRGNIESFQPRYLLLLEISELINIQKNYYLTIYKCKKNKVDMNILIDIDFKSFADHIPLFIKSIITNDVIINGESHKSTNSISTNIDILNLLLISLNDSNSIISKYPMLLNIGNNYATSNKTNQICLLIRNELVKYADSHMNIILTSILTSYIKNDPPLVKEAFDFLLTKSSNENINSRNISIPDYLTKSLKSNIYSSTCEFIYKSNYHTINDSTINNYNIISNGIKYLSILISCNELFNIALSNSYIYLCKQIIKYNSTMDPKKYHNVLSHFDIYINKLDSRNDSQILDKYQYFYIIHLYYEINRYLNDSTLCIKYFLELFHIYISSITRSYDGVIGRAIDISTSSNDSNVSSEIIDSESGNSILEKDMESILITILPNILDIIKSNNLYESIIPSINSIVKSTDLLTIKLFIYQIYYEYANLLTNQGKYKEACNIYLSNRPPNYYEAIHVSKLDMNWRLAISLYSYISNDINNTIYQSKFSHSYININLSINPSYNSIIISNINSLVYEIVNSYKNNLELSDNNINYLTMFNYYTINSSANGFHLSTSLYEKAIEAANLICEYNSDVDVGVNILLLAKQWKYAIDLSIKYSRYDLLYDEIINTVVDYVNEVIKALKKRSDRLIEVSIYLNNLWKEPDVRINQIGSVDPTFLKELQGEAQGIISDDAISEYSIDSHATKLTTQSYQSRKSNQSTMSSVSILSNISKSSTSSSFAIAGIDHALLSRGTVDSTSAYNNISRKQRRRMNNKEKNKVYISNNNKRNDLYEINKEKLYCNDLWSLSNMSTITLIINELVDILILLNSLHRNYINTNHNQIKQHDITVIIKNLQDEFEEYVHVFTNTTIVKAPKYPIDWLHKRDMLNIFHFQDLKSADVQFDKYLESELEKYQMTISWWNEISSGTSLWTKTKLHLLF